MNEKEMTENAVKLIKDFTDEYLHGNIDELTNFSFWGIAGNSKYDGTSYGINDEKFDGDRTNIVYAIDYLLYGNKKLSKDFWIPNYPYRSDSYCNYTGETINTFNTLFAKNEKKGKLEMFDTETRKKIIDESQKNNSYAKDFFHIYQRLGNFMLLPSLTVKRKSINSYRGFYNKQWKDYFDIFLKNLELKSDEFLNQLVIKNDFYFKDKSFDDFLKDFYLHSEDYTYKTFKLKDEHFAYWEVNEHNQDRYVDFSLDYIAKATELINKRSLKLVEVLKTKLEK